MEFLNVLILAAVQGLTEFLPVSSSGHLVLLQHWLGFAEGDVFLAVILHCGTLGSVLWVYRKEAWRLLRLDPDSRRYVLALAVGTLPAVFVGLLLKDAVEALFASPTAVGLALLGTAALLFSTRAVRRPAQEVPAEWRPSPPSLGRALLIGAAQAVAITPGISRSGATITASLWLGLERVEAARFSFLLSVPAIAGALVLHLLEGEAERSTGLFATVAGLALSFLLGLVAIRWTARAVRQRHFWKFSAYCLAVGLIVLFVVARG